MTNDNHIEIPNTLLRPFGPGILDVKIPDHMVKKLIEMTDDNSTRKNMDSRLAGQIESEPELSREELKSTGFEDMLCTIGKQYVENEFARNFHFEYKPDQHKVTTTLQSAWVVRQYQDEYNPVHYHTKCEISAVLYLIVPEFQPRGLKGKNHIDGAIEFIHGTVDQSLLSAGTFLTIPQVGHMLMFPSTLLHTVYPFKGDKERRSLAFNLNYKLDT